MIDLNEPLLPLWLTGWCLAFLVPATLLLSILSALIERSGPIRLRHWVEEAGGTLRQLYDAPTRFAAFCFLLGLTARLAPVIVAGLLWDLFKVSAAPVDWWLAPLLVAVGLALVEWLNRPLVERHSEKALSRLSLFLRAFYHLFRPAIWLLGRFIAPAAPQNGEEEEDDDASEGEIAAFIDVGRREGILEPEEEELVRSIVDFGDTQVRSVMTPRVEVNSVSVETTPEEVAKVFFECKHARLPVYRESIDHVVGILHIRDLFEALHTGRSGSLEELINPPYHVPESKTLRELLQELQALHQQMAIVVDEYGGVAGLVTVEDLLEEIVGDINDEHEVTDGEPVMVDEGRWRVLGRTYLEDLEEIFDLDLDLDTLPYETVSGLVCGELGYVPKAGQIVQLHGLEFTVEEADERRVTSVVVGVSATPETVESSP